ncbi:MAG TPA: NAD-dependent epimerase/dehydratase family protein [Vicinamibacterales bacterium]|nr:NAD-dependent epimerase/dehydratase family protein [Vicinamibacterales bacterium]
MRSRSLSLTGATGFVGWHVAEAFIRSGWRVRAVVRRGNTRPVPAGATVVEADLTPAALAAAFAGCEVVVHAAALIRARDDAAFAAVNVEGTRAAVEGAARVDARFVHISSQAAGGTGTPDAPRRESDPPAPVNAYGRSKLAAENVVRRAGIARWTILRPCAVYGPRDRGFLPLFRMARRGLFLVPTAATASFTLIHVSDLVRAVQMAVVSDAARGETLFVGHSVPQTGADVLRAIAAVQGRPFRPMRIPGTIFSAAAALGDLSWKLGIKPLVDSGRLAELRAEGFVCSVDRVRDVLGFVAGTDLASGVAMTQRWYVEHGWL